MTAACTGGTSAPKTGTAAVVDYSSGLLAVILTRYNLAWLIPVIPIVGLAPLTLATFCATDPPAIPTFTSAEANAILQLRFGPDFSSGIAKVKDLLYAAIWWDACECTSGTSVGLTPPSLPTGTPVFTPPQPGLEAPCYDSAVFTHTGIGLGSYTIGGITPPVGIIPTAYVVLLTSTVTSGAGSTLIVTGKSQHGSGTPTVDATASVSLPPGGKATLVVPYPSVSTTTILSSANQS